MLRFPNSNQSSKDNSLNESLQKAIENLKQSQELNPKPIIIPKPQEKPKETVMNTKSLKTRSQIKNDLWDYSNLYFNNPNANEMDIECLSIRIYFPHKPNKTDSLNISVILETQCSNTYGQSQAHNLSINKFIYAM